MKGRNECNRRLGAPATIREGRVKMEQSAGAAGRNQGIIWPKRGDKPRV